MSRQPLGLFTTLLVVAIPLISTTLASNAATIELRCMAENSRQSKYFLKVDYDRKEVTISNEGVRSRASITAQKISWDAALNSQCASIQMDNNACISGSVRHSFELSRTSGQLVDEYGNFQPGGAHDVFFCQAYGGETPRF